MTIAGLVLHKTVQAQLDNTLKQPSHAILLVGPLGIGKTWIARGFALELLQAKTLENQAYFREVAPVKNSISIEQIRELITFFRLKVPGKALVKRVAVLQDAETMGREAQNALLKLLEEPPEGSVLILTSSYPERLLSTVRSRTQLLNITAPDPTDIISHFTTQGHDASAVERVLLRTGSNMAEATRLLATDSGVPDESLNLVKAALTGSTYDRLLLVDALAKQKEQALAFVNTLVATALASLQTAAVKNPAGLTRWHAILESANLAEDALERSGNAKIVLTELMLAL